MVLEPVHCPDYDGTHVIKHGKTPEGKQRYRCQDPECTRRTFIREYSYAGLLPQVKQQICDMAMNGSGIAFGKAYAYGIRPVSWESARRR